MKPRHLIKQFKQAPWQNHQELENLVGTLDPIGPNHIEKLLDILTDRKLAGDRQQERMRMSLFGMLAEPFTDASLCLPYARALENAAPELRQLLLRLIPQVDNPRAHGELCSLLKSNNSKLRQSITALLPKLQRESVVQELHRLMKRPDFPGVQETLDLLVKYDYANAIQVLEQTIRSGNPAAQERALQYLSNRSQVQHNEETLRVVGKALDAKAERVKLAAIDAYCALCSEEQYFERIGPIAERGKPSIARVALRGARFFRSKPIFNLLERAFRKGPEGLSLSVLQVLEEIGDDKILPLLVKALSHPQLMVRTKAGEVLSHLGQTGRIELARAVIWLLRSKDPNVRRIAAELAQTVPDPEAQFWPKLMTFLLDEDWWVRERVMDTLMESAGELLARYVVRYLSAPSPVVRMFAVDVLGRLKNPNALGILVRTALNDNDWWVREKAIEAIGDLGDQRGVAYIVDIMNKEQSLQWSCIQTLQKLRAQEAIPHIAALINSRSSDIRLIVLRSLEALRAIQYAPQVEPLLQDPDPEVRKQANDLLDHWKIRAAQGANQQSLLQDAEPLDQLLIFAAQMEGQDLLISPGRRAFIKRLGETIPMSEYVFQTEQVESIILPHLTAQQTKHLEDLGEVDFSYEVKEKGLRFRANVFQQHDGLSAVFRHLKNNWMSLEELGLPPIARTFSQWKDGLVLIGGPTGAGKTMTLAAIIDDLNQHSNRHVICLEDPIEVVHRPNNCLINQREIGTHTHSYQRALRATLRQDPDVIMVGELRDLPTISFAITAADTGHLVLGTVHTVAADTTIDRLINAFPSNQQDQIRSMLSQNLRAVLCQSLLRNKNGKERHLAAEVLINNDAVSNMIRKGTTHQLPSTIASSREFGMQTMDQELMRLHQLGLVRPEEVYMKARNKKEFEWIVGEDVAEELEFGSGGEPSDAAPPLNPVQESNPTLARQQQQGASGYSQPAPQQQGPSSGYSQPAPQQRTRGSGPLPNTRGSGPLPNTRGSGPLPNTRGSGPLATGRGSGPLPNTYGDSGNQPFNPYTSHGSSAPADSSQNFNPYAQTQPTAPAAENPAQQGQKFSGLNIPRIEGGARIISKGRGKSDPRNK